MHLQTRTRGFSLLEVLIACGVLALISFALVNLVMGALKAQKKVESSIDFDALRTSVTEVLKSQTKCALAFQATGASGMAPVKIVAASLPTQSNPASALGIEEIKIGGNVIADIANPSVSHGLTLQSMAFTDIQDDGAVGALRRYLVTFNLTARLVSGTPGRNTLSQDFHFAALTDATNSIVACDYSSVSASSASTSAPANTTEVCAGGKCFLIDNQRVALGAGKNMLDANANCLTRGMTLCTMEQWVNACQSNKPTIVGMISNYGKNLPYDSAKAAPDGDWVFSMAGAGTAQVMNADTNNSNATGMPCLQYDIKRVELLQQYRCCKSE